MVQREDERRLMHDNYRWMDYDLRGGHSDLSMNLVSPVPAMMSAMAMVSFRNETARGQEDGENAG